MCGIVGLLHHPDQPPVSIAALRRMADAMRHRGPDDEGLHVDGLVGIGMRRLSIIDLAGGHQPVFNEDGSCAIVFNGEIYNYRELRQSLLARGHVFRAHSDTETIVHLYEEYGESCVEHLRGMFAFAIWDARTRRLLLARDRFGIKPLYVAALPWGIAFSSELKVLHRVGMAGEALDWDAIGSYFRLGYIPAPHSPFRDVRKLEPGHLVSVGVGEPIRPRRYWRLPARAPITLARPVERTRELLDDSVRAHLESDVPVAAFLSGGVDSSAVVASMAHVGSRAHVFTVRYGGDEGGRSDETVLATALAGRYGLPISVVDVQPQIRDLFPRVVETLDEPHADESAVPTWAICEAVASRYKVALVGTGGDELFAGYRRHFALAASGAWAMLPSSVRHAVAQGGRRLPEPADGTLTVTRLKRFLEAGGENRASRYLAIQDKLGKVALFSRALRERITRDVAFDRFVAHDREGGATGLLRPALYLDYMTYLPDDLLLLADRISMAHSLELRVPFVDHVLVEGLFGVGDFTRVGWGTPKRLLRRAVSDRLTPAHFQAPKRGFVGPTAAWLRRDLHDFMQDTFRSTLVTSDELFDPDTVQLLVREHVSGAQNRESVLWALLSFLEWHRQFAGTNAAAYRPVDEVA